MWKLENFLCLFNTVYLVAFLREFIQLSDYWLLVLSFEFYEQLECVFIPLIFNCVLIHFIFI